jgi:Spy/CpxP family protein refolding chaperone
LFPAHRRRNRRKHTMNLVKGTALAAILAGSLFAQRPFGGTPPDPATMIQNRVTHLTALLTLTTAQAGEATTIFTNAQAASAPVQTSLGGYRTSLEAAIKNNATATIDQLAASIGTATGQLTAIRSKAEAAFYAILTPAQQTALTAAGGGFGGGRGGPGRGGFGRGPADQ